MPDDLADTSVDHRDQVSDRELHQIVRRQIELLPDSQREAIDLWSYGFRYAEIANVMERPESTVRVLVHRGLTRLREDHTIAAAIGCESISRRAGTTTNTS